MRVKIRTFGPIKREIGKREIEVEVPDTANVGEIIQHLTDLHGEKFRNLILNSNGISGNLIILLNMKDINQLNSWNTDVSDGDTITVLPHIQGG